MILFMEVSQHHKPLESEWNHQWMVVRVGLADWRLEVAFLGQKGPPAHAVLTCISDGQI